MREQIDNAARALTDADSPGHRESPETRDAQGMDEDDRPPICLRCGVTMVPAALSADDVHEGYWVCLECEELGEEQ